MKTGALLKKRLTRMGLLVGVTLGLAQHVVIAGLALQRDESPVRELVVAPHREGWILFGQNHGGKKRFEIYRSRSKLERAVVSKTGKTLDSFLANLNSFEARERVRIAKHHDHFLVSFDLTDGKRMAIATQNIHDAELMSGLLKEGKLLPSSHGYAIYLRESDSPDSVAQSR